MTEPIPRPFNGFPNQAALDKARALVAQARDFPRAEQALRGLDAHSLGLSQVEVKPWGVAFGTAPERHFDEGLAGALGRALLKVAHGAPVRAEGAPTADLPPEALAPVPVPAPTPAQPERPATPTPAAAHAATAPPSTSAADLSMPADRRGSGNAAAFDEELDDDPGPVPEDYRDEGEEPFEEPPPAEAAARSAPAPRPAFLDAPAKPMSAQEVRAMMTTASSLAPMPAWSAIARLAMSQGSGTPAGGATRLAWVACGGALRKAARDAAGGRMRVEADPASVDCGPGCFGVFPVEIPGLAAAGSEEARSPEFLPALEAAFDLALDGALSRARLCGAAVVVLCGWGSRHDWARERAARAGLALPEA